MLDLFFPKIWAHESDPSDSPKAEQEGDKTSPGVHINSDSDGESFTSDAQGGVKDIEALTSVWTKRDLILAYIS
jgi:hypothetical protein